MNRATPFILVLASVLLCATTHAQDPSDRAAASIWVSLEIRIPTPDAMGSSKGDARGLGIVLMDALSEKPGEDFAWDEPNLAESIGFAFDVHNPPPTDTEPDENGRVMGWFDGFGNWYDRPQREVSVHANGRERLNLLSPYEFRTGEWVDVMVQVHFVLGGARVMVILDGNTIIDDTLWGVHPMNLEPVAGVVGEGIEFRDLSVVHSIKLGTPMPDPVRVRVFDEEFLENARRLKSDVDFSVIPERVGRVIATLTLSEPEVGYDHWDKKGTIGILVPSDQEGSAAERFEVFRFITPFRRGWTWSMDVTDLLPLFKDQRTLDAHIGTYMKGWDVSFDLDFYPGIPERTPIKVVNLWNGDAEIGNPENPVDAFYGPREVAVPEGTAHARVRATVTGHGMFPSSKNAGEFMPIWRTLTISSGQTEGDVLEGDFITMSARDHLWKTDVYLNPCRPQGGTWKFDRSGWAPGSMVEPWIVDVQPEFMFGKSLTVEYALDEYVNEAVGETWAPHHWTDAVVVFYK